MPVPENPHGGSRTTFAAETKRNLVQRMCSDITNNYPELGNRPCGTLLTLRRSQIKSDVQNITKLEKTRKSAGWLRVDFSLISMSMFGQIGTVKKKQKTLQGACGLKTQGFL